MALRTTVFLQSVNNLSDARYGAGMGVSMVGFPLAGPDALSAADFGEITGWLAGVQLVGEFGEENAHAIAQQVARCPVDYVLTERAEEVDELHGLNLPVVLRLPAHDWRKLHQTLAWHADTVRYFVLTRGAGGPITDPERAHLQRAAATYPVLLDFDLPADQLTTLLDELRPAGIALRGGQELRPGYRDFEALADLLERLEVEG